MEPITLSLLIFGIMIALMVVRVPIAVAMFVAGTTGYLMQAGWLPYANFLKTQTYSRFSNYDLSVIPLFLLMGQFATHGGLSRALFAFTNSLMSRVRGGMAMAAVIACAAFGAVCGSSVATAATVGTVALPEMTRHGYSGRLTTATLAAGGTLGIMIPPSVILVIYAILTEQNIAKLFAAAMIPGLIAMLGYLVAIAIYVRLVPGPAPEHDEIEKVDMRDAVAGLLPIGVIFLLVFGGIYGGVFTPTEGAAVGAVSTLLLAFARGELLPGRRELGDDLPDLHRRRPDELGAGAHAGADAAGAGGRRVGPAPAGDRRRDPGLLHRARLRDGRAVDDPADRADLLPDGHGARAVGAGPDRQGDLVRRADPDGRRHRTDRAAGRPERVHRQRPGEGRADRRELPRRRALPGQRPAADPAAAVRAILVAVPGRIHGLR